MNFLLHAHLAARDVGTRAAMVGAVLPDVWKMVDRRVRVRSDEAAPDPRFGGLVEGIAHHERADQWFHSSAVFADGERLIADAVRARGIRARHMRLLAHPLWEMCLDGALVRRAMTPTISDELGPALREFWTPAKELAIAWHFEPKARAAHEREAFEARMRWMLERFAATAWATAYGDGAAIASRAAGLRARLGLPQLSRPEMRALEELLDAAAPVADEALDRIVARVSSR